MIRRRPACGLLVWTAAAAACVCACGGSEPAKPPDAAPDRVKDAVIIVHGVGNQNAGYSKPMQDLLKAELPSLHVLEDTVVRPRIGASAGAGSSSPEKNRKPPSRPCSTRSTRLEQKALGSGKASPGTPQQQEMRDEYAARARVRQPDRQL